MPVDRHPMTSKLFARSEAACAESRILIERMQDDLRRAHDVIDAIKNREGVDWDKLRGWRKG